MVGVRTPEAHREPSVSRVDGVARQQEIIRVDEISPDVAAAKVRVRIGHTCFLDHLVLHRIDGKWLITSKGFHVEQVLPPGS